MKRIKRVAVATWVFFSLLLLAVNAPAASGEATALVKRTSERMLAELQKNRARIDRDPKAIYGLVDNILVPHFDFEKITRAAVGKHWGKASAQQKKALMEGFREVLIRTYAKSLSSYSNEEVRYLPEKPGRGSSVIVPTEVRNPGGDSIKVDYRLYKKGGRWKVFDVIIDRVSLVSNYRSSFNSQIRQGGVDGLVKRLQEMNAKGQG